jgi:membrane-associated phospholipid phosphatase
MKKNMSTCATGSKRTITPAAHEFPVPARSRSSILRIVFIILSAFTCTSLAASETEPFPYRLNITTEAVLLTAGCAAGGAGLYLHLIQPVPGWWETITLNKRSLPFPDRYAVGRNLPGAAVASSVLAVSASVFPLFLTVPYLIEKENKNALTLAVMYIETSILVAAINGVCRSLVHRKRPYMYVNNIFERSPRDKYSSSSFYSLHASIAFSSMTFLSTVVCDLYHTSLKYLILVGSLPFAGLTGYLRFAAGLHFPTDIIAGAVVGSVIGYLVPTIHKLHSENITLAIAAGSESRISINKRF